MKEYVEFILAQKKPKTNVYWVISKSDGGILGRILWDGPWRQYIFRASPNTIWSSGCLKQVCDFIDELMEERKK